MAVKANCQQHIFTDTYEALNNLPRFRLHYIKAEPPSEEHRALKSLFLLLHVGVLPFSLLYLHSPPLQPNHFNQHFSPWQNNPWGRILNSFGLNFPPLSTAWRRKRANVTYGRSLGAMLKPSTTPESPFSGDAGIPKREFLGWESAFRHHLGERSPARHRAPRAPTAPGAAPAPPPGPRSAPPARRGARPAALRGAGCGDSPLPARRGAPPPGYPSRPRRELAPEAAPHPWAPLPPPRSQGRGVGPAASERFRPGHGPLPAPPPAVRAAPVLPACCAPGAVQAGARSSLQARHVRVRGCRPAEAEHERALGCPGRPVTSWLVCGIVWPAGTGQ